MSRCFGEGLPPRLPAYSITRAGPRMVEHALVDQRVVDDDVGLPRARSRACSVSRPGSPGPAPTSHTQPGSKTGRPSRMRIAFHHARSSIRSPAPAAIGAACRTKTPRPPDAGRKPEGPLRRGWTTGACATAAAKAAFEALLTGDFPDPVDDPPAARRDAGLRAGARRRSATASATASVIKDAGDDPDVTHRREIVATVRPAAAGQRRRLQGRRRRRHGDARRPADPAGRAGDQPGAAQMMTEAIEEVARGARRDAGRRDRDLHSRRRGAGGEDLEPAARHRRRAFDPRHDRHRRALLLRRLDPFDPSRHRRRARRRPDACRRLDRQRPRRRRCRQRYALPDIALLDMGDFAGGLLKYLRDHPVAEAHHRRRLRQADEARAGRARPAFVALGGRPRLPRRAGARGRRATTRSSRRSRRPTPRAEALALAERQRTCRSPRSSRSARGRRRRRVSARRRSRSTCSSSTATEECWRRPAMARLLILGGTAEAAELAARLAGDDRLETVTSLAGLTRLPNVGAGRVRRGGFGGPDGLAAFLKDERYDALIDATHPFAAQIAAPRRRGGGERRRAAGEAGAAAVRAHAGGPLRSGRGHAGGRRRAAAGRARLPRRRPARARSPSRRGRTSGAWCA